MQHRRLQAPGRAPGAACRRGPAGSRGPRLAVRAQQQQHPQQHQQLPADARPAAPPPSRRAALLGLAAAAGALGARAADPPRASAAAAEPYLKSTGARGVLAEEEARLLELRRQLEGEVRREIEAERELLEKEARASSAVRRRRAWWWGLGGRLGGGDRAGRRRADGRMQCRLPAPAAGARRPPRPPRPTPARPPPAWAPRRAAPQSGNTLCATPFGIDIVGITEFVALVGALVGGITARQRKAELERLNEQLRKVGGGALGGARWGGAGRGVRQ
jgi:hypothetical protein